MITPMLRLVLVLLDGDQEKLLTQLGQLGAVHLESVVVQSPIQANILAEMAEIRAALAALPAEPVPATGVASSQGAIALARQISANQAELELVRQEKSSLRDQISALEPWGEFDPADLRNFAELGLAISFHTANPDQETLIAAKPDCLIVKKSPELLRFLHLSQTGAEPFTDFPVYPLPHVGLPKLRSDLQELDHRETQIGDQMAALSAERSFLQTAIRERESQLRWEAAREGMGAEESLRWLRGYLPADQAPALTALAKEQGYALSLETPVTGDDPPTLLRNWRIPGIIGSVFQVLGIVPGYRERDISWSFFAFFSLFFGMIIGDAIYGLLILALGGFALWQSRRKPATARDPWLLLTWFGLVSLLWGVAMGSWLALPLDQIPGWLQQLVLPVFNPAHYQSGFRLDKIAAEAVVSNNLKVFCFTLGFLQLGFASLLNLLNCLWRGPRLKALGHLGWCLLSISLFALILGMITNLELLGYFFPAPIVALLTTTVPTGLQAAGWVTNGIVLGFLFILFFSEQEGKFLHGIKAGIANILPIAIESVSALANNISYIRLFAVGLAGLSIGQSFNGMAAEMAKNGGGGVVVAMFILLFGHTLNLTMAFLAVIVHGIRLNVLEYSDRLGLEWSGHSYQPFSEKPIKLKKLP